ncbi:hypothetical protein IMX26_03710 [Clostridium sp. 'deep sea']|uniref:hypothetical protein n=1 Tax=Clostridium sp. 'deep sea' TaxID=2779445 RepID=UPI001896738B|nr:hypothetical protein [Clostridium sp. 'deep sea']QOR35937.1 hypothetical protein IMX26_03710 [Clostridium sp. 'deep sea']
MKLRFLKDLSKTTKVAFWFSSIIFVVVILNLLYAYLLHVPKLAGVVPASSAKFIETLNSEGESVELLIATVNTHIEDIDRYISNLKASGNIFHSTTLGVFIVDKKMADYIFSHQQFSDKTIAVNANEDIATLRVGNIIKHDITTANNMFKDALVSRNPIRWRRMIQAKLLLQEVKGILSNNVGEQVYGRSLTYKILKETQIK